MQKILQLVKQMGGSEELGKQLIDALNESREGIESQLQVEFQKRLSKAKKVCVEEVEREKADLRRKIEIFMESRTNTIDRQAQKQAAIGEQTSTRTLRGIKNLLEGAPIGSKGGDQANAALAAEVKTLRVKVNQLSEEKERLSKKAGQVNGIAQALLKRNKVLESRTISAVKKPVQESQNRGNGSDRLEGLRSKSGQPQTTRRTLAENQEKPRQVITENQGGDESIASIASQLDGSPEIMPVL